MTMTDPLGDMLTRIRNAQLRGKSKVVSPASKLRGWVLDVLADEGFIRGYAKVDYPNGKSEFEIELKYNEGKPVIDRRESCQTALHVRTMLVVSFSAASSKTR